MIETTLVSFLSFIFILKIKQRFYLCEMIEIISDILTKNTDLLKAARLFFWLKRSTIMSGEVVSISEIISAKSPFSRYQIFKYLSTLKSHNWIGIDKDQKVYLRGRSFLGRLYGAPKVCRKVEIPDTAFQNSQSWKSFVYATKLSSIARSVDRVNRKEDRAQSSEKPASESPETPVSLSIIQSHTGLSQTSASRMRKLASAFIGVSMSFAPLLSNDVHIKGDYKVAAMYRQHIKGVISKGGMLYQQLPSFITQLPTKRVTVAGAKSQKGYWRLVNSNDRHIFLAMSASF